MAKKTTTTMRVRSEVKQAGGGDEASQCCCKTEWRRGSEMAFELERCIHTKREYFLTLTPGVARPKAEFVLHVTLSTGTRFVSAVERSAIPRRTGL